MITLNYAMQYIITEFKTGNIDLSNEVIIEISDYDYSSGFENWLGDYMFYITDNVLDFLRNAKSNIDYLNEGTKCYDMLEMLVFDTLYAYDNA